jgi:Glycosyl hydrolases family 2, sugar binding domain.
VLDDGDWDSMSLPGYWDEEKQKPINGVVWFRRSFSLDNCNLSLPARLNLGAIVDADSVFVNDTFVGTTSYQYPPRIYQVPAGILKEGKIPLSFVLLALPVKAVLFPIRSMLFILAIKLLICKDYGAPRLGRRWIHWPVKRSSAGNQWVYLMR